MTDSNLWNKFKDGDKSAIEKIYFSNYEKLLYYGLKFSDDYHLIEDCIQDLFIYLIKNKKSLGSTNHIGYYLFKSLRRLIINKLKSVKFSINNELVIKELDSRVAQLEKYSKLKTENIDILKMLEELPARQKEIIYLKYSNGLKNQEIADVLQIKNQTVRNLLCKGLKTLKNKIEGVKTKSKEHKSLFVNILLSFF